LVEADEILLAMGAGLSLWWSAVKYYVVPVLLVLAGIVVARIVARQIVR
jgi:hypothetical protein